MLTIIELLRQLMERQALHRIEEILWTPEQVVRNTDMLVSKIDESWYPSGQLLDRTQRMMAFAAQVAIAPEPPAAIEHEHAW